MSNQHNPSQSRMSSIPGLTRPSLGPARSSTLPGQQLLNNTNNNRNVGGMAGLVDSMSGMGLSMAAEARSSSSNMRSMGSVGSALGRRSSVFTSRQSSFGINAIQGGNALLAKDPRPIRDKQWQANSIKQLVGFLQSAGYLQPISPKQLQAPSAKDFQAIFKFLLAQLDPSYVFQKKFEDEVPGILKGLRYPYADQISKSALYSCGSMHAWPSLLAMLTWMVELILACEQMDNNPDVEDGDPTGNPEKLFFDYLSKAYALFMAGSDNYDGIDQEMMADFDRKNEFVIQDVARLNQENEILKKELQDLTGTEAPIIRLDRENSTLTSDLVKFRQYLMQVDAKNIKLAETIIKLQDDIKTQELEMSALTGERNALQKTVDGQEISPQDVDRMTDQQEQLVKMLKAMNSKGDEVNKLVWEKEIGYQKTIDQLEKLADEYNALCYRVDISSSDPTIRFDLKLNLQAPKPELVPSADLGNKVKPALTSLQARYTALRHKLADEQSAIQESLDRLMEALSQKMDDLTELEGRIRVLNEQYNEETEVIKVQHAALQQEVEVLEQQIQRTRYDASRGLLQAQQKLQYAQIEYDQLTGRYQDQRERLTKQFIRALEDCVQLRTYVNEELRTLKKISEDDLAEAIKEEESLKARWNIGDTTMV
ncbi:hypothetical protein SmJEL517_g04699 [Synchytrium microbalum]|uniref:Kinetochore protein NDC80 n=1 Tax=Synchytrium microbalum TaxID=1806994 RepID=A0A507C2G7_9FUNG|nr:uncharacterized protein SmJEL517_g04699 [Synchytrium microbalum]TPX32146.1 hypothetical protein SmJEL517_g04699 [Synchytrium microbalum]